MSRITSVHDTFLRAILADKQIAIDYFNASLPMFTKFDMLEFSLIGESLFLTLKDLEIQIGWSHYLNSIKGLTEWTFCEIG